MLLKTSVATRSLFLVLVSACLVGCASEPEPQPDSVVGGPPQVRSADTAEVKESRDPLDFEQADTSKCAAKFGADPIESAKCMSALSTSLLEERDASYVSLISPDALVTLQFAQPNGGLRARQTDGYGLQRELLAELNSIGRDASYFSRLAAAKKRADATYWKTEDGAVAISQKISLENGSVEELVRYVAMVDGELRFTRYHSIVFLSGI